MFWVFITCGAAGLVQGPTLLGKGTCKLVITSPSGAGISSQHKRSGRYLGHRALFRGCDFRSGFSPESMIELAPSLFIISHHDSIFHPPPVVVSISPVTLSFSLFIPIYPFFSVVWHNG
jgi:hypothetical protein